MEVLRILVQTLCALLSVSVYGVEIAKRRPLPRVMEDIDDIKAGITTMKGAMKQLGDKDGVLQTYIDNMKNKEIADVVKTLKDIQATIEIMKAAPKPDCYSPPFLTGAEVTFTTTTVGSTATYKCKAGNRKTGGSNNNTSVCESNRMWTLVDLTCTDFTNCYMRGNNQQVLYRGTLDTTVGGIKCQHWIRNYPHKHTYMNLKDLSGLGGNSPTEAVNYCRDPYGAKSLWCYTQDSGVRWDWCKLPPPCSHTPYWVN